MPSGSDADLEVSHKMRPQDNWLSGNIMQSETGVEYISEQVRQLAVQADWIEPADWWVFAPNLTFYGKSWLAESTCWSTQVSRWLRIQLLSQLSRQDKEMTMFPFCVLLFDMPQKALADNACPSIITDNAYHHWLWLSSRDCQGKQPCIRQMSFLPKYNWVKPQISVQAVTVAAWGAVSALQ